MPHRDFWRVPIITLGCIALSIRATAQSLPPDVRAGHWAATPVQIALKNQILSVEADKNFHGDAKVTHRQAVIALARLGKALETGVWQRSASVPVSFVKTSIAPKSGAWENQGVSRYVFATVLTRIGDYANNGLVRAKPSEKAVSTLRTSSCQPRRGGAGKRASSSSVLGASPSSPRRPEKAA